MRPTVLYEDNHVLVLNKPAGMPSQGDETGDLCAIDWAKQYIKEKYQKPGEVYLALLHRLDRPVAGALALARTSKAAQRLSADWQAHKVEKKYWALVHQAPPLPEGTLHHWLRKLPDKNIVRAYKNPGSGAKEAITHYRMLQQGAEGICLLEVEPKTGRQHQIRVQLAAMGCTIVGDVKYGKSDFLPDRSIALMSRSLGFAHPTTHEWINVQAPVPSLEAWRWVRG